MEENKPKSKPLITSLGVVIFIAILLLAFIAIPNFIKARSTPSSNACINNLRQIDAAKQQWALENAKTNLDTIATWNDVRPYLGRDASNASDFIYCPKDTSQNASNSYTLGNLGTFPRCKIDPEAHQLN